ncbi:minor tail protein [Arthrobacter phage Corgi]|uniref:Minor tail protein n=1 Tax=Arthrobacter phage Corgi TaxID=2419952 RepID=A0A3G2KF38_9CAUD|nr:minor tail protein [Arthrobacter phage Corgi]AYN57561.1 minor tail protein [Arthrobacter phage Corgi]
MAAITAELLPQSAAVRLSVNAAAGIRSITRSDANGVNDVRPGPGILNVAPELAPAGTNLILNPTFEVGTSNWTAQRCTLSRYTWTTSWYNYTPGPSGAYGMRLTADGVAGGTYAYAASFAVTPGDYAAAMAVGSTSWASGALHTSLWFYDAGGAVIGSYDSPLSTVGLSVYKLQELTVAPVLVPATAVTARLLLRFSGNPPAGTFSYWDRAMAVTSSTSAGAAAYVASYWDGTPTPSIEYKTAWTGTAHASTSTRMVPSTPFVVTDYEAASGPIRYDVVDLDGRLESLDVNGFVLDSPWLFTPIIPGYSRQLRTVRGIGADLENLSTVHAGLLGRTDPIVVMRPVGLRAGTMTIWAGTYAAALDIVSPLKQATPMMLRQPDHAGLDMYFAPLGAALVHEDQEGAGTTWGVQVRYQEIKRPEGDIAGALGWTYADLEAAVPRYSDLPRTFATYADMRLNKRITP